MVERVRPSAAAGTARSCTGEWITHGGSRFLTRLITPAECLLSVFSKIGMDILRNETTKIGFEPVGSKMMLRKCCENEKHEIPLCKIKVFESLPHRFFSG